MVKCESLTRISLFSLLTSLFLSQGLAAGLDTLRLRPNERILIIAPHPDDEVLACGGLIQQALALGDSVWVVYVTAGDGSWPAAWRVTGNMFPSPGDYLELGRARIEEAKAGAKLLGLDTTHLVFLGYPDADLDRFVFERHSDEVPVKSSHTGVNHNPYGSAGADYTGGAIVDDLYQQIVWHHADRVFFPDPLDAHPDHWATAATLPSIRGLWRRIEIRQFPTAYYYLIHRSQYPNLNRGDELSPPADLTGPGHHWYTLPIAVQETTRKRAALECHWSQFTDLGPDLTAYVARNELFDLMESDSGTARGDAPAVGFLPGLRIDSLTASLTSWKPSVFKLYLPGTRTSGFDYHLYLWSLGPYQVSRVVGVRGDLSDEEKLTARALSTDTLATIAEPLSVPSDSGWTVYLPSHLFGTEDTVFFTADVRWKGQLLNHTGVGWVVPNRH
jgi:LmbE family N-acetylglucosaminyl deacetylase